MYLLNYLYFIILSGYGVKFLGLGTKNVKHPFLKKEKIKLNGTEMFLLLTFATGTIALSAPGSIDLMAIRLLFIEIMCLIGIIISKRRVVNSNATIIYLVLLFFCFLHIFFSPTPAYGFRVFLKYLAPYIIMMFASSVIRNDIVFFKVGIIARKIALISLIISFIPFNWVLIPGFFWYGTALAIHYIVMCIFSFVLYQMNGRRNKDLLYTLIFCLPCLIWVFRTSIMGTAFGISMIFLFRYKIKAILPLTSVILIFIGSVFFIPAVKEKMFKQETSIGISDLRAGDISLDKIESNGRFAMWEDLLHRFYTNNEILGSGIGNVQHYMNTNFVFGGLKVPHNDYVQILCDIGLVGLSLFVILFISIQVHCFTEYNNKKNSNSIRMCALISSSSLAALCLTMYTDNVINYSMATLSYPFGFYGIMLGLIKAKRIKQTL